jgi:yersiniabactin salicyl-AMP ligase
MCDSPSPVDIFFLIEEHGVTFTGMVAPLVNLCLDYRVVDDSADLSSVQFLLIGGSMLQKSVAERVEPILGCKLVQIFGIAEGLTCKVDIDDPLEIRLTCQGKPISPYDEIRIVDADGNDVEQGDEGELITRGPYTIRSYYGPPEISAGRFTQDGYYRTGDRARITERDDLQILGRMSERINRAGEKIAPSEVEEILSSHPDIFDCAVIGVTDVDLGERICAFILSNETAPTLQSIREFLRSAGLAEYKLPDQLVPIVAWPLTYVGKPDRNRLVIIAGEKRTAK